MTSSPSNLLPRRRRFFAPTASARRGGFSLLELLVVMAVLTMSVGMFSSTLVSTARHSRMQRELAIAAEAARCAMEVVRGVPAALRFATFNTSPADDPGGAGTAPGGNFAVQGLDVRPGDADGRAGMIRLPAVGVALREDLQDSGLGMPRDLNGDGLVDSADHAGDHVLLPVHVRIEWKGVAGDASFDLYSQVVRQ